MDDRGVAQALDPIRHPPRFALILFTRVVREMIVANENHFPEAQAQQDHLEREPGVTTDRYPPPAVDQSVLDPVEQYDVEPAERAPPEHRRKISQRNAMHGPKGSQVFNYARTVSDAFDIGGGISNIEATHAASLPFR
jgi:hypothetical protein